MSSIIAEKNNEWKDELIKKLEDAIKDCDSATTNIERIIIQLKEFTFTE